MSAMLGQWRATYSPGDWLVLGGPTSLVLLEPLGDDEPGAVIDGDGSLPETITELMTDLRAQRRV